MSASGVFFGTEHVPAKALQYIGMPQGADGNIIVIGGNGSGKSTGIAKPTLRSWRGAICATDIKGELSDTYIDLYRRGAVDRQCIIFDPVQANSPSYDPFWWLLRDKEYNLSNNIMEIVYAIIPIVPELQPFWVETERSILAAALLLYF